MTVATQTAQVSIPALLDIKQVAAALGVSVKTVRRMKDGRDIPRPILIGRLLRWSADGFAKWMHAGCPKNWAP